MERNDDVRKRRETEGGLPCFRSQVLAPFSCHLRLPCRSDAGIALSVGYLCTLYSTTPRAMPGFRRSRSEPALATARTAQETAEGIPPTLCITGNRAGALAALSGCFLGRFFVSPFDPAWASGPVLRLAMDFWHHHHPQSTPPERHRWVRGGQDGQSGRQTSSRKRELGWWGEKGERDGLSASFQNPEKENGSMSLGILLRRTGIPRHERMKRAVRAPFRRVTCGT